MSSRGAKGRNDTQNNGIMRGSLQHRAANTYSGHWL